MKLQGVKSDPEVEMSAPETAPVVPAGGSQAQVVDEVYGLQLADDANGGKGQALVAVVNADKPAGGSGLLVGDVIKEVIVVDKTKHPPGKKEDEPLETSHSVSSREQVYSVLLEKAVWGQSLKFKVFRNQKQQIDDVLLALFGTPDDPNPVALDPFRNNPKSPLYEAKSARPSLVESYGFDLDKLEVAAGRVQEKNGRQYGLYRLHCAHCHGITGDGAGPTAAFLNPYPRDYRQGKFKFKSTEKPEKPTHADLLRILTEGIPGTAMPSFRVLPENEREALVEYVQYLSVRGQTEIKLIELAAGGQALPPPAALIGNLPTKEEKSPEASEENIVSTILQSWNKADEHIVAPIEPPKEFVKWITRTPFNMRDKSNPPPELSADDEALRQASLKRGRFLFNSDVGTCYKCHGDSQLGDGQTTDYDDWFKWRKDLEQKPVAEQDVAIAEFVHLGALPPRTIKPRDLRMGVYRGGRRPMDIYRRIFTGIEGTPMPALGRVEVAEGQKIDPATQATTEDVWHLVHYVLSLPYEPLSQPPAETEAAINPSPTRNQDKPTGH